MWCIIKKRLDKTNPVLHVAFLHFKNEIICENEYLVLEETVIHSVLLHVPLIWELLYFCIVCDRRLKGVGVDLTE